MKEAWEYVLSRGFEPGNDGHILILNGDMVSKELPINQNEQILRFLSQLLDRYSNIKMILGNHELSLLKPKYNLSLDCLEFIKSLPQALVNKELFICHGWFNPKWKIENHFGMREDDNRSGEMVSGSPSYIWNKQKNNKSYWGYDSLEEYVAELQKKYPNKKFIFGHAPNFLWNYKPAQGITYSAIKEAFINFKKPDSLFQKLLKEYDYSKPFIDPTNTIYCSDVFTKIWLFGEKYYFLVFEFNVNTDFVIYKYPYDKFLTTIKIEGNKE